MTTAHTIRFPGETDEYRAAREKLLDAEVELRRQVERVAAMRRALPVGGEIPQDYVFEEGSANLADREQVQEVQLSELFEHGKDTLMLYSYMYGPAMAKPCRMCTSLIDSLDGAAVHLNQRVNFAIVARSPVQRIRDVARERGWTHLTILSSANNTYNWDYHAETPDGAQLPVMTVFVRRDGAIRHFYSTEMLWAQSDLNEDSRHVDMMWPLWNMLDLTPEGRGSGWGPKLSY
jgi:predicted dithiol-disulfide oxidoreductase (DUF899 family)